MTTTPPPGHDLPERILGNRYRLGALLGAGGMGVVYAAKDLRLQRRVAVKVLPPHVTANPLAAERLRAEALAAAALEHPFICEVHEIGETSEQPFILMEYVHGETLHRLAARQPLTPRQMIDIAAEVAEALDEAHRRNVIHRDLKPANIMLTAQGHRVPLRPVQPIARFFYGSCLAERDSLDARERGREMLVEALNDFRALGMTVYARHAEQALAVAR